MIMIIPRHDGSGPKAAFIQASKLTVVIGESSALNGIETGSPSIGSLSRFGGCESAGCKFVCEYLRLILSVGILVVFDKDVSRSLTVG